MVMMADGRCNTKEEESEEFFKDPIKNHKIQLPRNAEKDGRNKLATHNFFLGNRFIKLECDSMPFL